MMPLTRLDRLNGSSKRKNAGAMALGVLEVVSLIT